MTLGMTQVRVTLQRDCFGGGRLVDIELGQPVDESMLDRLSGVASRQILRELPKPFFRFDVPGRFLVSGILGESRIRFTVRLALKDQAERVATEAAIAMTRPHAHAQQQEER